jgi:hypothetical protein
MVVPTDSTVVAEKVQEATFVALIAAITLKW